MLSVPSPVTRTEKLLKVAVSAVIAYFVSNWTDVYLETVLLNYQESRLSTGSTNPLTNIFTIELSSNSIGFASEILTFIIVLVVLYRIVLSRI
jgi:hypothetical protein